MKRVPIFACLVGLHAALAAAALLWALHVRFGDPLTAALCPAQGSPWEQGKAAFFPLLAAAPVIWSLSKGGSRGGLCAMALAGVTNPSLLPPDKIADFIADCEGITMDENGDLIPAKAPF